MNANEVLIRGAIAGKTPLQAVYRRRPRLLCPHTFGTKGTGRDQKVHILSYQIGGESNSRPLEPVGSPSNWRCMKVSLMEAITLREDLDWGTAAKHTQPQNCIDDVWAEVSY